MRHPPTCSTNRSAAGRFAVALGCGTLAALRAWGSPCTAADDRLEHYAAMAELRLQSGDGLQRLELPLGLLQASRSPHYADVRIFDARGEAVPLAWVHAPPAAAAAERTLALPRFAWPALPAAASATTATARVQVDAAGAVIRIRSSPAAPPGAATAPDAWLLDLSALGDSGAERIARLQLDWPARAGGLATNVQVEGSDDTRTWRHITRGPLLDLAQAGAPALKQVNWPAHERTPRYLRLHFDTPLTLSRSDIVLSRSPPGRPRAALRFSFTADATAPLPQPWVLDLQGRVPVSHIAVHLPQVNSVVGLQLQQRDDTQQPWRTVASFTSWRLTREGREMNAPATSFQAPPARHWRLLPAAGPAMQGAGPLQATLEWTAPQLVFAARGVPAGAPAGPPAAAAGLRLAVGRAQCPPTAVPLASLIPGYTTGAEHQLPAATLAALHAQVVAVPGLMQRLHDAGPAERQRWALWAVLLLAVAGLGALAWKLLKEVSRPSDKP